MYDNNYVMISSYDPKVVYTYIYIYIYIYTKHIVPSFSPSVFPPLVEGVQYVLLHIRKLCTELVCSQLGMFYRKCLNDIQGCCFIF